jgi:hypothetical protein
MLGKALIFLFMVVLLSFWGCVTGTPAPLSPFGPCAMKMDEKYCGP